MQYYSFGIQETIFSSNVLCLLQSKYIDMKFKISDYHPAGTKASFVVNCLKLETELKDYVIKQEVCGYAIKALKCAFTVR